MFSCFRRDICTRTALPTTPTKTVCPSVYDKMYVVMNINYVFLCATETVGRWTFEDTPLKPFILVNGRGRNPDQD